MYSIVEIAGKQYKVEAGNEIYVNRLEGENGDALSFDKVLLTGGDDEVTVGTPTTGGTVAATIIEHVKGDKVIVFKKKRRKGYKVKNGFRHSYTKIKIDSI